MEGKLPPGRGSKMALYPKHLEELINLFKKFPTVGQRSAERFSSYLLKSSPEEINALAEAILNLRKIKFCSICYNITETQPCEICSDGRRDRGTICVVEEHSDFIALEKTEYNGLYHILGGRISPLEGVGPDDLKIEELMERIKKNQPREIIIATNTDTEGETTALYLSELIKPLNVSHSRIAYGLSAGSNIANVDQLTLRRAMEGRKRLYP